MTRMNGVNVTLHNYKQTQLCTRSQKQQEYYAINSNVRPILHTNKNDEVPFGLHTYTAHSAVNTEQIKIKAVKNNASELGQKHYVVGNATCWFIFKN